MYRAALEKVASTQSPRIPYFRRMPWRLLEFVAKPKPVDIVHRHLRSPNALYNVSGVGDRAKFEIWLPSESFPGRPQPVPATYIILNSTMTRCREFFLVFLPNFPRFCNFKSARPTVLRQFVAFTLPYSVRCIWRLLTQGTSTYRYRAFLNI